MFEVTKKKLHSACCLLRFIVQMSLLNDSMFEVMIKKASRWNNDKI